MNIYLEIRVKHNNKWVVKKQYTNLTTDVILLQKLVEAILELTTLRNYGYTAMLLIDTKKGNYIHEYLRKG